MLGNAVQEFAESVECSFLPESLSVYSHGINVDFTDSIFTLQLYLLHFRQIFLISVSFVVFLHFLKPHSRKNGCTVKTSLNVSTEVHSIATSCHFPAK